jgi:tRNA1Val (adenine37-N6)-methyltransferase
MGVFRFKKFEVVNERSAMKVNTDGVLLGAAMTILPSDRTMLDVGTGTGTIALMAAQRLSSAILNSSSVILNSSSVILNEVKNPRIDAIDIDEASASEASANFINSPWNSILKAHHLPLEEFAASAETVYDLIFSNPPYFEDSLTAPDERKSTARHTSDGLSYRDIFEFAKDRLSENGRVSLVLPADQEAALTRYARMCGLYLFRILRVRTVPRKAPSRIIAEFSRTRCAELSEELLTIQDEGKYTQEYLSLTGDFYLFA